MKRLFLTAALISACAPTLAADVGVSVSIGQPGFYGRVDIGNFPRPQVVYAEPVIIQPTPIAVVRQPVYLHVPPGHAKDWGKHCGKYNACGQPVYFVQDRWYNDVYVPQYRERRSGYEQSGNAARGKGPDKGKGKGNGKGNGNGKGKN